MNRGLSGALSTSVAIALLAGCGGPQPPIGTPGVMPQSLSVQSQTESAAGAYGYCQGSNEKNVMVPCPITLTQKNRSKSILAEPSYEEAIVTHTSCHHYCYIKNLKNKSRYFKVTHGPKCGAVLVLFRWYSAVGSHPLEATYGEQITNEYCPKR